MTLSRTLRPVLGLFAGSMVASCGVVEGKGMGFEDMARSVADIPVDGQPSRGAAPDRVEAADAGFAGIERDGLRPAFSVLPGHAAALTVEVMDPHDLWDARDGLRRPVAISSPAVVRTVNREHAVAKPVLRPDAEDVRSPHRTIQLGAYSSQTAARAAWSKARSGKARSALAGLEPELEIVQVSGRSLVRLRVSAPATAAAAICHAADVSDPWCLRGA